MLTKDVLELLLQTGENRASLVVKPSDEPAGRYFVRQPDGTLKPFRVHLDRAHTAADLTAILDLAAKSKNTADETDEGSYPEIWYDRTGVVLFTASNDRWDRVSLKLDYSAQLKRLQQLETQQPAFTQVGFIRELRITFRDGLSRAGNLVHVLRQVKFNASQSSDASVGHGKVSIGKSLMAQVTGADVIPESVVLDVPIFSAGMFNSIRADVECALEPNAENATFQLIPFPGEIEKAVLRGESALGQSLRENLKGTPEIGVYYGRP